MRYSLYCQALQPEELFDLPGNDVHKFCSGFNACPCDVRCDKKPVAVREAAKRIVFGHRFYTQNVQTGSLYFICFQLRFLNLLPRRSDHVPDLRRSSSFFHLTKGVQVHKMFCMFIQRCMYRDNIGSFKKCIKRLVHLRQCCCSRSIIF